MAEGRRRLLEAGWRDTGETTVAFCPGSTLRWNHKRWPNEHYVALARGFLGDRPGAQVLIFCGPDEAEDARYFREQCDSGGVTVVEGMPLMGYAGALTLCGAVVTGDSLPLHMAAALQVPQVALFGPTDPRRTGPWMCPSKVLVPDCDYIPFYRMPYPPDPTQFEPCMPKLPVEDVAAALDHLLSGSTSE